MVIATGERRRKLQRSALSLALCLVACADSNERDLPFAGKNIVLVVVDTLRADHLAPYGYEHDTAPLFSDLAREGLLAEGGWSTSSWTLPATASLFTSLHPEQHGLLANNFEQAETRVNRLPASIETLPEVLRRHGYRTYGIADNFNIGRERAFDRGFDRFETTRYVGAERVNTTLRAWSDEITSGEGPFFVYLHYMDPHAPYRAREPWFRGSSYPELGIEGDVAARYPDGLGESDLRGLVAGGDATFSTEQRAEAASRLLRDAYDSEIRHWDEHLRDALELLGARHDAIVIVTADHGEELGDRGRFGHHFSLHDELVRVPFVVRLPGGAPGRLAAECGLLDVLPTLRALLGDPPSAADRGQPLIDADGTPHAGTERALVAHRLRPDGAGSARAIRLGRYKAIEERPSGRATLFDLASDPGEEVDLAAEEPETLARLLELMAEIERDAPQVAPTFATVPGPTDEELREIEKLGYAGGE